MRIKFTETGLTGDQITNLISLAAHQMPSESIEPLHGKDWVITGIQLNCDLVTPVQRDTMIQTINDCIDDPESIADLMEDRGVEV